MATANCNALPQPRGLKALREADSGRSCTLFMEGRGLGSYLFPHTLGLQVGL